MESNLHLAEIVQLHGRGEVEEHVGEVGALVAQLVQYGVGDKLDGKLDVPQRRPKPDAAIRNRKLAQRRAVRAVRALPTCRDKAYLMRASRASSEPTCRPEISGRSETFFQRRVS